MFTRSKHTAPRAIALLAAMVALTVTGSSLAQVENAVDPKTDPLQHIRRVLERDPLAKYDPEAVLVRFKPGASAEASAMVRTMVGGKTLESWTLVPGLEKLLVTGSVFDALDMMKLFPDVVMYAELDYIVHASSTPNDLRFGFLWGLNNTGQTVNGDTGIVGADINAPEAWDIFTGDANFVIANIDTGVTLTHADLAANIWVNPGEIAGNGIDDDGNGFIDDINGWDFINNDNDPTDDHGHGTHTAGTIGAVGNNGIGVTGVVWQCKIMPLKSFDASGSGSLSTALSCLQYGVNKGVKVSNNSYGFGAFSQSFLDGLIASQDVGHIFVAAAGNHARDIDAVPLYPASYTAGNVIAVASTTSNDTLSSFSNYGVTSVDIGAPGSGILSAYRMGYAYLSGTSQATPHVVGVVALVYGFHPTWTWSEVRTQVLSTARPIDALTGRCVTGGVVNAAAALGPQVTIPNAPGTPSLTNLGGGSVEATWSDNSTDETGFTLERQERVGNAWTNTTMLNTGANVPTYTDTPGTGRFRYRVRAFNGAGNSTWSNYHNITL